MPLLEATHISKSYPGLPVLHDVSFTAEQGEIICLLGPSGCGKSTLLRIVAGLESSDTGRVLFAGQDLAGIPPHRRNFGLMFQDYALFPHRDVAANVAFGLRMQARSPAEIAERLGEMLDLVKLSGYERRQVVDLSGGEQQRVALARSLAPRPRLLMLDEPLGALDRALREQLMNELRAILKQVGVTAIYVTHDQEEAFAIADRVLIMRGRLEAGEGGRVEQAGTPQAVYRLPATPAVAAFLGFRNLLPGTVAATEDRGLPEDKAGRHYAVETALGRLEAGCATRPFALGDHVTVLVRPEAAEICPVPTTGPNVVPGTLVSGSFRGSFFLMITAHAGGVMLTCEATAGGAILPAPGAPVVLRLDPTAITLLPGAER